LRAGSAPRGLEPRSVDVAQRDDVHGAVARDLLQVGGAHATDADRGMAHEPPYGPRALRPDRGASAVLAASPDVS
jgi:hypothetical protein